MNATTPDPLSHEQKQRVFICTSYVCHGLFVPKGAWCWRTALEPSAGHAFSHTHVLEVRGLEVNPASCVDALGLIDSREEDLFGLARGIRVAREVRELGEAVARVGLGWW